MNSARVSLVLFALALGTAAAWERSQQQQQPDDRNAEGSGRYGLGNLMESRSLPEMFQVQLGRAARSEQEVGNKARVMLPERRRRKRLPTRLELRRALPWPSSFDPLARIQVQEEKDRRRENRKDGEARAGVRGGGPQSWHAVDIPY